MTSQAVALRIDQLDALSRRRALTDFESDQLVKLIATHNRYTRAKAQQDRLRASQAGAR